jgi:hypothetical protein
LASATAVVAGGTAYAKRGKLALESVHLFIRRVSRIGEHVARAAGADDLVELEVDGSRVAVLSGLYDLSGVLRAVRCIDGAASALLTSEG